MDRAALLSELTQDPLERGYATMSDPEVAASLNNADRPSVGVVDASEVRRFVLMEGIWPYLVNAAQHPDSPPLVAGTALTILQTLAPNSFDQIRMNDPAVSAKVSGMLEVMVQAGVMTQEQRADMIALGNTLISRADELGLGPVSHVDVGEVRLGNG